MKQEIRRILAVALCGLALAASARAFEGKIGIVITQGSETTPLLYHRQREFSRAWHLSLTAEKIVGRSLFLI